MNKDLLEKLMPISEEEQAILDGKQDVQKELYTSRKDFVVDSGLMLEKGKLIDIRPHTRFVHFPMHKHNYVEIIYMCSGSTTHIINGHTTVKLETGELLFLNQNATQEIMPAGKDDIAVNFIILPEFFDRAFLMMEDESILRDFLVGSLKEKGGLVDYLHFQVRDILPIQNLVENLIYSLVNKQAGSRNINQTTMGLLFILLQHQSDRINRSDPNQYEQNLIFTILKYVEDNYKTATLTELSEITGQPDYYISKLVKKHSGYTFKNLLQTRRLNQAAFLLSTTLLPVEDIITLVGYDNTSYFHRIFREYFHMTPKVYRNTVSENMHPSNE
ncbi:MAG: AraC family transcriptional regulator [Lachnospiraceae bacterium]